MSKIVYYMNAMLSIKENSLWPFDLEDLLHRKFFKNQLYSQTETDYSYLFRSWVAWVFGDNHLLYQIVQFFQRICTVLYFHLEWFSVHFFKNYLISSIDYYFTEQKT